MRIGGQEVKPTWLLGGGLLFVVLAGLFFDVWQSYARRKNLEYQVREVAGEAAKYLPFRPREAVQAGILELQKRGLPADQSNINVSPDGYGLEVSVSAEATAWFAWIVGYSKIPYQAKQDVVVELAGGGPVEDYPAAQCALAIVGYSDFSIGQNVVISASGDSAAPDYALKAWHVKGPATVTVGAPATVETVGDLKNYASPQELVVVILGDLEGNMAPVKGFAALDATGIDDQGRLTGRFIRKLVAGETKKVLPSEANFGLLRGGTPKVTFK